LTIRCSIGLDGLIQTGNDGNKNISSKDSSQYLSTDNWNSRL